MNMTRKFSRNKNASKICIDNEVVKNLLQQEYSESSSKISCPISTRCKIGKIKSQMRHFFFVGGWVGGCVWWG